MSEEIKDTNTEQQPTDSTQEDKNGGQGSGKTFTQEDVNRIVAERLAKERAKGSKDTDSELDQREKDLSAREAAFECMDYLDSQNKNYGYNYPSEALVHLLGATDLPNFKDKLREFETVVNKMMGTQERQNPKEPPTADSLFRKAFGLKSRKE